MNSESMAKSEKSGHKSLELTYDESLHSYNGVQGKLYYGQKEITLSTLPVIRMGKTLIVPVQEVLETVLGYTFSLDSSTGVYTATDPDLGQTISFTAEEYEYTVTEGGKATPVYLGKPIRMISVNGGEAIPCIPANKLFSSLGMKTSWDEKKELYSIRKGRFFDWNGEKTGEDSSLNYITHATGDYDINDNMATLHLNFYGDREESFEKVKVNRDDKLISVTIPQSVFLPPTKEFARFGEIAEQMTVSEAENTVTISVNCFAVTEFTYVTTDNQLHLQLLWDYSVTSGNTANYSMTIKRPDINCLIDKVSIEDLYDSVYYQKAFKIIIKGNHTAFYKENPVVINNNSVKKVTVSLNKNDDTEIKVTTRSLQACKVYRQGNHFVVQIKPPRKLYKNIVVLDAGHGDHDNGCSDYGFYEKDLNLKMICTQMKKYFNKPDGDTKIYWTRRTDKFVTLDDRSKFASKVKADIFISLHMNWASNKQANGTEVYYSTDNNRSCFSGLRSSVMAHMMDSALVDALDNDDRGVRTAGFYVIKRNTVPSILIELGFLSGNKDHKNLTDPDYQKEATKTMADVINQIFEKHPTGR